MSYTKSTIAFKNADTTIDEQLGKIYDEICTSLSGIVADCRNGVSTELKIFDSADKYYSQLFTKLCCRKAMGRIHKTYMDGRYMTTDDLYAVNDEYRALTDKYDSIGKLIGFRCGEKVYCDRNCCGFSLTELMTQLSKGSISSVIDLLKACGTKEIHASVSGNDLMDVLNVKSIQSCDIERAICLNDTCQYWSSHDKSLDVNKVEWATFGGRFYEFEVPS